ncbi:unnamed protein product, partial [marine sediment metagenome]
TMWTEWTSYGTDEESPWSWAFTSIEGDGYYEFYSIAVDDIGNAEEPPTTADASIGVDTETPVTTHTLDGTMGENRWYVSDVNITISATDALSGIASIWYMLDSGNWENYTVPLMVSDDGALHRICYYSYDVAGNRDVPKIYSFKIDKTPPVTEHKFNGLIGKEGWFVDDVTVTLGATDAMSGVNYIKYKLNDGNWMTYEISFIVTEDGEYTLSYYSVD